MPPIPPIAPEPGENPAEEAQETPEQEQAEVKVEIKCAAKDCKFNKGGYCSNPEISVSAGPGPKCETYEPVGGAKPAPFGGMKPPAPPLPMGMGGM